LTYNHNTDRQSIVERQEEARLAREVQEELQRQRAEHIEGMVLLSNDERIVILQELLIRMQ